VGKVYKDKKSKGCALCKPHKHGWAPKKKPKVVSYEKEMDREIKHTTGRSDIISVTYSVLSATPPALRIKHYTLHCHCERPTGAWQTDREAVILRATPEKDLIEILRSAQNDKGLTNNPCRHNSPFSPLILRGDAEGRGVIS